MSTFAPKVRYTRRMKALSLAVAVAGVLGLAAPQAAAFLADPAASKAARSTVINAHHRLEPAWSRHYRLRLRRSLAWPGSIPGCVFVYPYWGPCPCCTAPDWEQWYGYY